MRIKKILNFLPTTTMFTGLILASALAAPLSQSQNIIIKSDSSSEQTSSRATSVVTDEIDFKKIKKNNFSWKDDYGGTNGYVYTNIRDKNITAFTINSSGFTVNTSYPKYSVKSGPVSSGPVYFQEYTSAFYINSQTYDPAANTFGTFSTLNSKTMYFGNTDRDTFSGFPSYSLNRTRPYMQFVIPIVSHKIQYNRGLAESCGYIGRDADYDARWLLRRVNNRDQVYSGNANVINEKILESGNHQNPGGMNEYVWHWHSELASYNVTISLFNNYDLDGNLLSTHMFNHGKSFNTVLPTVSVDETKINRQLSASSQNIHANEFVILNNGQGVLENATKTLTTEADDMNGTLKITFKPEYIFSNGVITKNTTNKLTSTTITGFALGPTNIMARDDYPGKIVIDKWRPAVTDVDGNLDPTELAKYLQLIEIPDGSVFTFSDFNPNLVTGELKFKIKTDKYYDWDMNVIESDSRDFEITLNLTPRITHVVELEEHPKDLYVNELYPFLFDETGFTDLGVLNKYAEIIAPVDNANYYLVPDSYDIHTGDGTATFKLYADEYYDAAANQNNGAADIESSHFAVTFGVKPLASVMQVKDGYPADLRVDEFLTTVGADANGLVADTTILEEYITLENIPSAAQIIISDFKFGEYDKEFIRSQISFDLTSTIFNQKDDSISSQTNRMTLTLNGQHMPTDILALDPSQRPKDTTPEKFMTRIANDGAIQDASGIYTLNELNIKFLSKFLKFNSIPAETVFTFDLDDLNTDNTTGKIAFDLTIDRYFDANGDLDNTSRTYRFSFDFANADYVPEITMLTSRPGAPNIETEQVFLELVFPNKVVSLTDLGIFVMGLDTIPGDADVLDIWHVKSKDKVADFMVQVSGYYDGESSVMHNETKIFSFQINVNVDMNYVNLTWLWILLAVGGSLIILLIIYLVIRHRSRIYDIYVKDKK